YTGGTYGNSGDFGGDGGYGYTGGYDLTPKAKTTGVDIGAIAQYDRLQANDPAAAAAAAAAAARNQADAMANTASGTGNSVLEGSTWDANTITWSLADSPGT